MSERTGSSSPMSDPGAAPPSGPSGPSGADNGSTPEGTEGREASAGSAGGIGELQGRIGEVEGRISELADRYRRALADLDNTRKRCAVQISQAEARTRAAVAREWLSVIDGLDGALAHAGADPASIIEGVQAVRDEALRVVERLGFGRRDDQGARFDPARHEAIALRTEPGADDGSVVAVIRPRYGEGENQLRPAQVVVARSS